MLQENKSMAFDKLTNGIRAWELVDLQSFMESVVAKDKDKTFDTRVDILMYNVADLIKSKVYKKFYGKFETDLLVKISDVIMISLALCVIANIPISKVVYWGIQRYHERVWETKSKSGEANG